LPGFGPKSDLPAELLGHDVVGDRESKSRSTVAAARSEEWVERFALDGFGHTLAVITKIDFYLFIIQPTGVS
jgi:hypothetical protein